MSFSTISSIVHVCKFFSALDQSARDARIHTHATSNATNVTPAEILESTIL